MAIIWSLVLLVVSGHIVASEAACDSLSGRVERHNYYASLIQTRLYYSVYLPPCYGSSDETYPVLYLLHGSNEDDGQWLRLGLADTLNEGIAAGELPPMIVVMPFGDWIANENRFGDASWGGIFLNQLMPLVEEQYRIRANRATRAIGGISRGGFWAFHIALRNPVLFGAVGGHSAFFDQYHAPPEHNPLHLARDSLGVESVRIWLDRGRDDFAAPGLDLMHEWLSERGVEHTYQVYPEGQHYQTYWRQHVRAYLDFYAEPWLEPAQPAPTETPPEPTATPIADIPTTSGYELYLPVVAFPSRSAHIEMARLRAIAAGDADRSLVLAEETAERLRAQGIPLNEQTRTVPAGALYNTLWRDRTLFTLLPFDRLMPRYRVLNIDELHPLDHDLDAYLFAFDTPEPNYQPERLTRLLMSGVTALARGTIPALDANGVEWAASGIQDYVSRADFFHTSNEVSMVPGCPQPTAGERLGGPTSFCSKREHFELFPLLGLDIVELSGNHNNDFGYDAYRDTLDWYAERGIMTVGGGETLAGARRPLLLEHNGNRVALVSCNWVGPYYALVSEDSASLGGVRPGAAFCDLDWLRDLLPRLRQENDLVVLTVQYFEFDEYVPRAQQRNDFRLLANLGADVVLGTQAHFPQTYEFFAPAADREAFIHYGLGNLFFDQQFFAGVRFFMDQLFIYDGRLLTVDVFTGIIEAQGRPRPMTPEERDNFLFLMFNQYGEF